MARKILNTGHFLSGCRFDIWLQLIWANRSFIPLRSVPQVILLTIITLVMFPFALLERLLFAIPIQRTKIRSGPLFILGHWRMGTTFIQNLICQDPQFGWLRPMDSVSINNSILLGWFFRLMMAKPLKTARPMDNLTYSTQAPMEDLFAISSLSPDSPNNMLVFPKRAMDYLPYAYVDELPAKRQKAWFRMYDYILKKTTFVKRGKPLLLKSPDNTCRTKALADRYPTAKFVHIYRDPYLTIRSFINMFLAQFESCALGDILPLDFIEDAAISNFVHMYQKFFVESAALPPERFVEVRYEDFEQAPLHWLEHIYDALDLPGFAEAEPAFARYIASQKGYVKNKFTIRPQLRAKINAQLGFYFTHYGYEIKDTD